MGYLGDTVDNVTNNKPITCDTGEVPTGEPTPPFDRSGFLERIGGNEQLLPEFIVLFRKVVTAQITALSLAVERRDAEGVRMYAHAVKGSSANIAALRLMAAAEALEYSAYAGDLTAAEQDLNKLRKLLAEFNQVTGEGRV